MFFTGSANAAAPKSLPPKVEAALVKFIQTDVKGWGEVDMKAPKVLRTIDCFTGMYGASMSTVYYDIFPSLGLYRVAAMQRPLKGLIMDIALDPKTVAVTSVNDKFVINKNLEGRISACASGVLNRDLSKVSVPCSRDNSYRLVIIKVWSYDGNSRDAKIIINAYNVVYGFITGKVWKTVAAQPVAPEDMHP